MDKVLTRNTTTKSRKASFGGFLARSTTSKSTQIRAVNTGTNLTRPLEILDGNKGPLGLTTIHEPPGDAVVDLVFVHGLGGGSRKTWSFSSDPGYFWPQEWLPADPDFTNVRIHSFGYRSEWGERRQSILNIYNFAQSLVGALKNHPGIRRGRTHVSFVCHSMGGCVAKKAYILAREDPTCDDLSKRIHSMFFLGTPHRGSSMATILENMLTIAWSKKPFVTDLMPNSTSLTAINDVFRHFAPALRIWSFYETLPIKAAGMTRIVVDQHSAVLGYANEEVAAMDADHRRVCKFETQADPNYKMLRNSLLTAVDMMRKEPVVEMESMRAEIEPLGTGYLHESISPARMSSRLRSFFGVDETYEGDLWSLQALRQPGSCRWLTEKQSFSTWRDGTGSNILWLTGRPAIGKSVLSTQVIDSLKFSKVFCSYYFFKHTETGKSTLGECFRSLAFQMAVQDSSIAERVLQLEENGLIRDNADDTNIWRRLFVDCIFKLQFSSEHAWVIDGVDECSNFQELFTKRLLTTLPEKLRLFATSRDLEEIRRGVVSLNIRASLQTISDLDTIDDMRHFLTAKLKELGKLDSDDYRHAMCEKILAKSKGSFLWARLVLQEFGNAWTEEAMESVLSDVPLGLSDLYSRMIRSIERDNRKKVLARSILSWVVLAARPLSLDEVRCAVKIDVGQTLQNVAKAVPDLCGQIVFIDQDDRVHLIHETAREFLVSDDLDSELAIDKKQGHRRLGFLLLEYLSSDAFKIWETKLSNTTVCGKGFAKQAATLSSTIDLSLIDYSARFFSEHLCRSSPEDDDLLELLASFFKMRNVLCWIEHVAKSMDLSPIMVAAMNIREYLTRRLKYLPPKDSYFQVVNSWVVDLIRVSAKFRSQLLACPSSIHCLIPPICPPGSIMSRTFADNARPSASLTVTGLPPGTWDDCLIRMGFQNGQTTAICHGDCFFAVGLSTGQISVYDPVSVQGLRRLIHPERVKLLEFSCDDMYLASCGTKHIVVWEPKTGTRVYTFSLQSPPLAVMFLGVEGLFCAHKSRELTKWCLNTGDYDSTSWLENGSGDEGLCVKFQRAHDGHIVREQAPSRAALLYFGDEVLLAVGYRSHPIQIWSALDVQLLGKCSVGADLNGIDDMTFNPNPEMPTLIVAYQDGALCVFDCTTMSLHFRQPDVFAHNLACSSDGHSLVVGSSQGSIDVFEFDYDHEGRVTLTPIYRVSNTSDELIRGVAFSLDGRRFVDIAGQQARVWAPACLVRKQAGKFESSTRDSTNPSILLPTTSTVLGSEIEDVQISSPLVVSANGGYVVAGRDNGDVVLFSADTGKEVGVLYQHSRGASIVSVVLCDSTKLALSADDSGRVIGADISTPQYSTVAAEPTLAPTCIVLDRRFNGAIVSLLPNATGDRLLVCGRSVIELWKIPSGRVLATQESILGLAPAPESAVSRARSPEPVDTGSSLEGIKNVATTPASTIRSSFQHPGNPEWFVVVTDSLAHVHAWADFAQITSSEGISLARNRERGDVEEISTSVLSEARQTTQLPKKSTGVSSYLFGSGFVIELHRQSIPRAQPRLYIWPAAAFDPSLSGSRVDPTTEPHFEGISPAVLALLGFSGPSTLVFLDVNLWVCSTELQSQAISAATARDGKLGVPARFAARRSSSSSIAPPSSAKRHFFALSDWRAAGGEVRCTLAKPSSSTAPRSTSRDVVFANGKGVVVVKGGLEFSESVSAPQADATSDHLRSLGKSSQGSAYGMPFNWQVVSGSMRRRTSNW